MADRRDEWASSSLKHPFEPGLDLFTCCLLSFFGLLQYLVSPPGSTTTTNPMLAWMLCIAGYTRRVHCALHWARSIYGVEYEEILGIWFLKLLKQIKRICTSTHCSRCLRMYFMDLVEQYFYYMPSRREWHIVVESVNKQRHRQRDEDLSLPLLLL